MKRNVLLILAFYPLILFSQNHLSDSFLGISLASTREAILNAVQQKGGVVNESASNNSKLVVSHFSLNSWPTENTVFLFNDNLLYHLSSLLKPADNSNALELFNSIKAELDSKYGQGNISKTFSPPYKDGDGSELIALRRGFGTVSCSWETKLVNDHKASISLSVTKQMLVLLSVEDENVFAQVMDLKKKKSFKY